MLRSARLVLMVLVAMLLIAVPTTVAQSPIGDQYTTQTSGGGAAGSGDSGAAPVQVRDISSAQAKKLPFTGGQISLIALLGLGLLAVGCVGVASTRRRASATAS
ncbi:MAG: hypothetical protein QOI64_1396 [Solirubrobacteraceae bacterium]|nr:hypothetical protein [Solirubrobacteraceae bacterium]